MGKITTVEASVRYAVVEELGGLKKLQSEMSAWSDGLFYTKLYNYNIY
jgi:hypothetical protein